MRKLHGLLIGRNIPWSLCSTQKPQTKQRCYLHVSVVNTEDADTLLGMSVLRKIGLTANPYKGRLKYYVNWKEPNARKAYLKSTFPVDRPLPTFVASSSGQVIEVVNAASQYNSHSPWTALVTGLRQLALSSVCAHIAANSPRNSLR
jgi:hypothetical protein